MHLWWCKNLRLVPTNSNAELTKAFLFWKIKWNWEYFSLKKNFFLYSQFHFTYCYKLRYPSQIPMLKPEPPMWCWSKVRLEEAIRSGLRKQLGNERFSPVKDQSGFFSSFLKTGHSNVPLCILEIRAPWYTTYLSALPPHLAFTLSPNVQIL